MANLKKAVSANPILNGVAVFHPKNVTAGDVSNFTHYCQGYETYASGDSLNTFQVLESRFDVEPSGWSA